MVRIGRGGGCESGYRLCAYPSALSVHARDAMAKKPESTGSAAAKAAAKVMKDPSASKDAKSAAASALTQSKSKEETSPKAAKAAAKVLADPKSSKDAKVAAASTLTQKTKKK
jgi:hypothetical protein